MVRRSARGGSAVPHEQALVQDTVLDLLLPEPDEELLTFRQRVNWARRNVLPEFHPLLEQEDGRPVAWPLEKDGTKRPWLPGEICKLIAEGRDFTGGLVTGLDVNFDGTPLPEGQKTWYSIKPTYLTQLCGEQPKRQPANPTLTMLHVLGTFWRLGSGFFVEDNVAHARRKADQIHYIKLVKRLRQTRPDLEKAKQMVLLGQRGDGDLAENITSLLLQYEDILAQVEAGAADGDGDHGEAPQ